MTALSENTTSIGSSVSPPGTRETEPTTSWWDQSVLRVPLGVLLQTSQGTDVLVYSFLARLGEIGQNPEVIVSHAVISRYCRLSPRAVRAALTRLSAAKLIRIRQRSCQIEDPDAPSGIRYAGAANAYYPAPIGGAYALLSTAEIIRLLGPDFGGHKFRARCQALRLYALISAYAHKDVCWHSTRSLARALNVSRRTIFRHLAILAGDPDTEVVPWLTIVRRCGRVAWRMLSRTPFPQEASPPPTSPSHTQKKKPRRHKGIPAGKKKKQKYRSGQSSDRSPPNGELPSPFFPLSSGTKNSGPLHRQLQQWAQNEDKKNDSGATGQNPKK